jgi:magnesium chelatase accessory protein
LSIAAPILAKLAAATSGPAWFIAKRAINMERVGRLIKDTGSDPTQIDTHLYKMLFDYPAHIRGTLKMMAHWELAGVRAACARLALPTLFISADLDRAIGPGIAAQAVQDTQNGTLMRLKNLGHLAHEEDGAIIAEAILAHWLPARELRE